MLVVAFPTPVSIPLGTAIRLGLRATTDRRALARRAVWRIVHVETGSSDERGATHVVNVKAAAALGRTVPPLPLAATDRAIE